MTRLSVATEAYHRLRNAITEQRLEPGTSLSENDVARALGISRTPVREALTRLELEGFATRDGHGRLAVARLNTSQLREIFDLRSELEAYAARLAAERISDEELEALERAVEEDRRALEAGNIESLGEINQRIHDIVLTASRNRVLVNLVDDLRQRLAGLAAFAVGEPDDRSGFVSEHARMAALLRSGNGQEASDLVRHHLESARDLLLTTVEKRQAEDLRDDLAGLLVARDEPDNRPVDS